MKSLLLFSKTFATTTATGCIVFLVFAPNIFGFSNPLLPTSNLVFYSSRRNFKLCAASDYHRECDHLKLATITRLPSRLQLSSLQIHEEEKNQSKKKYYPERRLKEVTQHHPKKNNKIQPSRREWMEHLTTSSIAAFVATVISPESLIGGRHTGTLKSQKVSYVKSKPLSTFSLMLVVNDDGDDLSAYYSSYLDSDQYAHKYSYGASVARLSLLYLSSPSSLTQPSLRGSQSSFCDQTISSWRRGGRVIHLLGTAHISSKSADLAGMVVREVKPDAIFLELDLKRISRAFRNGIPQGVVIMFRSADDGLMHIGITQGRLSELRRLMDRNPFRAAGRFFENIGNNVVGSSVHQFYNNLEGAGFLPGEEFVVAVEEGNKLGAVIVLGDRDMDSTMYRLSEAFQRTDLRELLKADALMTKTMAEELPEISNLKAGDIIHVTPEEMKTLVETMKTKKTTKKLMNIFQGAAPELYNALVTERDEYMSLELDSLSQFNCVVAIIGLGHQPGVEKYLRSLGWKEISKLCSA